MRKRTLAIAAAVAATVAIPFTASPASAVAVQGDWALSNSNSAKCL